MGIPKTITVSGTFPGATITIEASVDGGTVYAPVAVFQSGSNEIKASFVANFMRVNVSGRSTLNPFSANIDVGAPDAAGQFGDVNIPAGNGVGTALDVSDFGVDTTFIAGGSFAGAAIRVEISEDNVAWAPLLQFTGQGGLKTAVVTAAWVRARVSGRTTLTPFSGTLSLGAAADPIVVSGIDVEDEGTPLANNPHTTLNFVGDGVTATDAGGGVADITIPGDVAADDEGTPLGRFTTFDFVGSGVTATDAGGGTCQVTVPGGDAPTTEHLSGDGSVPINLDVLVDTSFINCSGVEQLQVFLLAEGSFDGQIHNFVLAPPNLGAVQVDVTSMDPSEAGDSFLSTTNNANFTLIWNDAGGEGAFWQVLGTPRNFSIS